MICEKCGAVIPEDRTSCISCGAVVDKPDWVEEIEKKDEIPLEDNSFKGKTRGAYYGVGASTIVIGLFIILILFFRLPYIPGLILATIMILIVCPIAGMVFTTVGMYKIGVVFTGIGAYTAFPAGIAGHKHFKKIWNFGTETKNMIKSGEKSFIKNGTIIKPPLPLKIGVIVIVVLMILIPVASYMFVLNKPMLAVTSYHVPREYRKNSEIDVKVTLYNYGHKTAEEGKIQINVHGSGAGKMNWDEGDIGVMQTNTQTFSFVSQSLIDKIIVFYDGEKVYEKEIEGMWLPTSG